MNMVFSLILLVFSQCDTLWTNHYGGVNGDYGHSVDVTNDGDYIVGGSTFSYGAGLSDVWIIKLDSLGNCEWDTTYGDMNHDYANSIIQTSDGGYIFTGVTCVSSFFGDVYIGKTNELGNLEWDRVLGEIENEDAGYSVIETSDSNYVVAAGTYSYGSGGCDAWIIKVDQSGNILWDSTYGGNFDDIPNSIIQDTDGNFVIAGQTKYYGGNTTYAWFLKLDSNGNVLHETVFGGADNDWFEWIAETYDGGYILAGTSISYGPGGFDGWLVKTDMNGNEMWNSPIGGPDLDDFWCVRETSDRGFILTGCTSSFGSGETDMWIVRTDSLGNETWSFTIGGDGFDGGREIKQTASDEYIVVGSSESFSSGMDDVFLVKIRETVTYLADKPGGNEYFFSRSKPNPFRDKVDIFLNLPQTDDVNVSVYNISGELIWEAANGFLHKGFNHFTWHGRDRFGNSVPSGVYYYKVKTEQGSDCSKLILIK